jgi:L-lactate dehydrogenase
VKIAVIGSGAVGSACLLALVLRGSARQIVVLNRDRTRARAIAMDIGYGASLAPIVEISDGDYPDLAGSDLVVIAAGTNEKGGGATDRRDPAGRLRLLETNVGVFKEILPRLSQVAPDALVLVLTDPPDPLADLVRTAGFTRVLSSGTYLDSLRFRHQLARRLNVAPASVDAYVLGEHGTSEVFMWSSARVGTALALDLMEGAGHDHQELRRSIEHDVRYANIAIIEGNQASQYGIGIVAARITEAVLRDERVVMPVGSYNPTYGATLSMPSVVGRAGVLKILEPSMSEEERHALERSAETLREAVARYVTPAFRRNELRV